jgi:dipeptidyl aminopeptidase/acylaminoacyl peptidase
MEPMIHMKHTVSVGVVATCLSIAVPTLFAARVVAREVELIPRQIFFGNPDRSNVQISPDGKRLSYLAPSNGVTNVWVQATPTGEQAARGTQAEAARAVTNSAKRPIRMYFWAQNSQQIIYAQDRDGDENFHLYAVDLENGKEVDLTPYEKAQARLTASDRSFPDEILVSINNRLPELHDVWRINTRTGKGQMIFQNDAGYAQFIADSRFEVRVASKVNERTGGLDAYIRASADSPWEELARWGLDDSDTSGPIGLSRDGKLLYVMDSRGADTGGLYAFRVDANGGTFGGYELIANNPRADLADVVMDPIYERPQAVAFEYARNEWKIVDRSIQGDWDYLSRLAQGDFSISSRDNADRLWVVTYLRDDGPVSYYLYDRKARKASFLFTNRSQLENLKLAKMKPELIPARDGLTLVSYLTVPIGVEAANLPMVLLVHGGPWARDRWGYNGLHQWLANRGYAVLSVNFRGSTGFGKRFLNAGNREWAGKMHDDLIDAVIWAVQNKVADPDRVAIMGGSYGGYATLVGLTFTPDFFAAGVDIVGPSHVRTLLETIPPYWKPIKAKFETRVGSLNEAEFLDQISPLKRVNAISKPLLIGQGRNDPRVKETESRQIVKAMQDKGLPVTYVVFPDEGHGFARPQNNLAFFAMTEAFLAQHLGGRFEPIGSAVRESSAQVQAGADLIPGASESGDAAVEIDAVDAK